MAGGDHHSADGVVILDGIRYRRGGRIGVSQMHDEVVARQHARHLYRVTIAQEARVKAHDDLSACSAHFGEVFGDGLCHAPHIVKGEIFTDDGPPAVGAKMNCQSNYLPIEFARM